jgi:hypothetical protein
MIWGDDDFMSMDKEDREETGRRLSGPLSDLLYVGSIDPASLVIGPDRVIAIGPKDELVVEDINDDARTPDDELTLDELADRMAGSLS